MPIVLGMIIVNFFLFNILYFNKKVWFSKNEKVKYSV